MDAARVARADPLAWLNSVESWLQVSKLVVCVVRKTGTAPGDVAGIRSWEPTPFGDQVSWINPEAEFSLDGFRYSGDGEERWVSAASEDSKHGGRVDSGVLREARWTLEAVPICLRENIAKP